LTNSGLSSIEILYSEFDRNSNQNNTPANDYWELQIAYQYITAINQTFVYITFKPDGSIDNTRTSSQDLDFANKLLAPAIANLQSRTNIKFDFWQLINWLFVSVYWTALYDVGQIHPVSFDDNGDTVLLPSTNNIFVNQVLFGSFSAYMRNTVVPLLNPSNGWSPNLFDNLNATNVLNETDTTFVKSYQCVQRQIRSPLGVIVAVIVADHALIGIPFALVIWLATKNEKRRHRDWQYCEGCVEHERSRIGDEMGDTIPLRTYQVVKLEDQPEGED